VNGDPAVITLAQVETQILCSFKALVPFSRRLHVHRTYAVSLLQELGDQMASNEASGSTDDDRFHLELLCLD
jgi:hypothetical protein